MAGPALELERDYEFGPAIVWDALVDADLLSGWLGEATVTPEIGGEYTVRFIHRPDQARAMGEVTDLVFRSRLRAQTTAGAWEFTLTAHPGGNRGTRTRLRVAVWLPAGAPATAALTAAITADWMTNLDQLYELLHGHPVDWATWHRDWSDDWAGHLADYQHSTG